MEKDYLNDLVFSHKDGTLLCSLYKRWDVGVRKWGWVHLLEGFKVASFMGARVSSEHANLTAPLKLPSSSFVDARGARIVVGSSAGIWCFLVLDLIGMDGGSVFSLSWLLIAVAGDLWQSSLPDCLRWHVLKHSSQFHEV